MKHDATGLIRILLVHDHALLREALRILINANPDLQVVGEARHCAEAVQIPSSQMLLSSTYPSTTNNSWK